MLYISIGNMIMYVLIENIKYFHVNYLTHKCRINFIEYNIFEGMFFSRHHLYRDAFDQVL